jgi:hypothetical protein
LAIHATFCFIGFSPIDEAQHFAKVAKGSTLFEHLEHLKSLAVATQTVHVL